MFLRRTNEAHIKHNSDIGVIPCTKKYHSMKKAIFSCLFGDYDELQKAPKFEGWDTILFTDSKPKRKKGWEVIQIESSNPKINSRRYKLLSHKYLPEYDLVCYHDANVILKEEPPSKPMWMRHPRRRKIVQETNRLLEVKKITRNEVVNLFRFFRRNRFNDNAGLYQNSYFVREHSEKMNKLMELTFEVVEQFSYRDQLALPYATWKLGYRPEGTVNYFLSDKHIEWNQHKQKTEIVNVHHITPARSDKNFGKAINQLIEGLAEQDWICLRDIDTFPPDHVNFIKQVEELANNPQGYSLIGCMTNRLGLDYQKVPGMFNEFDVKKHREKAVEISGIKTIKPLTGLQTVGGVMMLFSKQTWLRAGKFPEGGILIKNKFVDYLFSVAVSKFGKLGIAEGVYLYHNYRIDAKDTRTYKDHLR